MRKINWQWGKKNNLNSNGKQDYFSYPISRQFCLFYSFSSIVYTQMMVLETQ